MNGQIDWRTQQTSHLVCSLVGQMCSEALRNFLNMDRPEHHSIDRLKERGVEKGRERSAFNQTNIGTVSRATLERLLRDGAERIWGPFRALRCHLELKLKLKQCARRLVGQPSEHTFYTESLPLLLLGRPQSTPYGSLSPVNPVIHRCRQAVSGDPGVRLQQIVKRASLSSDAPFATHTESQSGIV